MSVGGFAGRRGISWRRVLAPASRNIQVNEDRNQRLGLKIDSSNVWHLFLWSWKSFSSLAWRQWQKTSSNVLIPFDEPLKLIEFHFTSQVFRNRVTFHSDFSGQSSIREEIKTSGPRFLLWIHYCLPRVAKLSTKTFFAAQNQPSFINHFAHLAWVSPRKNVSQWFSENRVECTLSGNANTVDLHECWFFLLCCSSCVDVALGISGNAKTKHELVNKKAERRESFLMEIVCDCC